MLNYKNQTVTPYIQTREISRETANGYSARFRGKWNKILATKTAAPLQAEAILQYLYISPSSQCRK